MSIHCTLVTGFQRGGLWDKLCNRVSSECFSLHALWDAELHKYLKFSMSKDIVARPLQLETTVKRINSYFCDLYKIDSTDDLETYATKFAPLAKYLLEEAAEKVLWLLGVTLEMDSLNTAQDFERELTRTKAVYSSL